MATRIVGTAFLSALLLSPTASFADDSCDGAGKVIDNIAEQIAVLVKPCEMTEKNPCEGVQPSRTPDRGDDDFSPPIEGCVDNRQSPCSASEWASISKQIQSLTERANQLSQGCFGVPYGGGQ